MIPFLIRSFWFTPICSRLQLDRKSKVGFICKKNVRCWLSLFDTLYEYCSELLRRPRPIPLPPSVPFEALHKSKHWTLLKRCSVAHRHKLFQQNFLLFFLKVFKVSDIGTTRAYSWYSAAGSIGRTRERWGSNHILHPPLFKRRLKGIYHVKKINLSRLTRRVGIRNRFYTVWMEYIRRSCSKLKNSLQNLRDGSHYSFSWTTKNRDTNLKIHDKSTFFRMTHITWMLRIITYYEATRT